MLSRCCFKTPGPEPPLGEASVVMGMWMVRQELRPRIRNRRGGMGNRSLGEDHSSAFHTWGEVSGFAKMDPASHVQCLGRLSCRDVDVQLLSVTALYIFEFSKNTIKTKNG